VGGAGSGENLAVSIVLLPVVFLGFVVARRQPGNPPGWMFLALAALGALCGAGADHAWLGYRLGHHLPLAAAGVVLVPVRDGLAAVVQKVLEPAHVSVWIRADERR
jgi:hypothetical protein